jgi:hypothetical protein
MTQNEDNIEHKTQNDDNKAQERERGQQGHKKQNEDNIEHKTQNVFLVP